MHTAFPPRRQHSKTALDNFGMHMTKMMMLMTLRRRVVCMPKHVSRQATSDYHRLLRELTDSAAIVVIQPCEASQPSAFSPCARPKRHFWSDHSLSLNLGRNSLRFGCFILKCSQVHEMIHQPWLCLVIWLVFWMTKRPDNSLGIIKSRWRSRCLNRTEFSLGVEILLMKFVHRGWESAEGDWKRKN